MPSRPMSTTGARRVSVAGTIVLAPAGRRQGSVRIAIDVTQAAGASRAKGAVGVRFPDDPAAIEAIELGVLQTTRSWASVTARFPSAAAGSNRFMTFVIERADPFVAGHPATVTVDVGDAGGVSGTLRASRALVLR